MYRYSQIARPLNDLISGENAKKKSAPVEWGSEQQKAFDKLKGLCNQAPILVYADYKKPFRVYTDASEIGLGAVISQIQDGKEPVIAYASHTLNKAERRYDTHKLDFLALKWAITDRFHEYLYGGIFEVFTDNNPLTYILTSAKLDTTGQRWVAALSIYNFQIFYRSGRSNKNVDALSRIPWGPEEIIGSRKMDAVTVKAVMTKTEDVCVPLGVESVVSMAAQFFAPDYAPKMNRAEWRKEQEQDQAIHKILSLLKEDWLFKYRNSKTDDTDVQNYLKARRSLCLIDGLLHQQVQLKHHQTAVNQFVLPRPFRRRMVMACHDEMGHLGMDRMLLLLQDRVYWPGMSKDVREHIRTCERCEHFKERPSTEEIEQTEAEYPLEMIHVDFLVIGGKKIPEKILTF